MAFVLGWIWIWGGAEQGIYRDRDGTTWIGERWISVRVQVRGNIEIGEKGQVYRYGHQ